VILVLPCHTKCVDIEKQEKKKKKKTELHFKWKMVTD